MKFVIQSTLLYVEKIDDFEDRQQPFWTPTLEFAMRFDSREAAEAVWGQHQDNKTMQRAEIVPVES